MSEDRGKLRAQRIAEHFAVCESGYGFGMHREDVAFLLSEAHRLWSLTDKRADEERRASALILDLRATITRVMGELQTATAERDELRDMRKMGYELRLKQALDNIAAERKETA